MIVLVARQGTLKNKRKIISDKLLFLSNRPLMILIPEVRLYAHQGRKDQES